VREFDDLRETLRSGEADFVILDQPIDLLGVMAKRLGTETNVMVESVKYRTRKTFYLDHDENDTTTQQFFAKNGGLPEGFSRSYLDDIEGIIEGVTLGYGRAIIPKHLICKGIKEIKGYKPLEVPIFLNYFKQPFYSKMQEELRGILYNDFSKILSRKVNK